MKLWTVMCFSNSRLCVLSYEMMSVGYSRESNRFRLQFMPTESHFSSYAHRSMHQDSNLITPTHLTITDLDILSERAHSCLSQSNTNKKRTKQWSPPTVTK
jgi:hypothetical protein